MKLKPLGNRLVLKKLESEVKTASGIALPSSAQEKPDYAEVVALSSSLEKDGDVKIKDRVIYSKYSGTEVKDGDEEYIIIKIDDILAIVE